MVILARRFTYRRGFSPFRGGLHLNVINSIKNVFVFSDALTPTVQFQNFAKAVTSPSPTVTNDVSHGCVIKAVWISIDFCGTSGTGVLNNANVYIMKNPGANLSGPSPENVGSSNEKKFVIKQWHSMIMRNQDGNVPYHWEGWIKIPKRYQRMGTDDLWQLGYNCTTALAGHISGQFIYKWYR